MSLCSRCGASFMCAMTDGVDGAKDAGSAPCWCTTLPPLPADVLQAVAVGKSGDTCLCPACLRAVVIAAAESRRPAD